MTSYSHGQGDLIVKVGADISGLRKQVKTAATDLNQLGEAAKDFGSTLKGLAATAAIGVFAGMVKDQMQAVDATAKLARQLGGTIAGLQGLKLAASDAGVDAGALQASMEALNKKMGEAARTGKGEAYDAFKRLGLSARELGEMDVDQRMAAIADAIKKQGLSAYQASDALSKMGLEQGQIVRLMLDGGDATRAARTEVEALGIALSDVDAARVEHANDALERVGLVVQGMAQHTLVALAPAIEQVAKEFINVTGGAGGFAKMVKAAGELVLPVLGYMGDGVQLLYRGFLNLKWQATAVASAVLSAWEGAAHAIELVTGENSILDKVQRAGAASRQALVDIVDEQRKASEQEWFHEKMERVIASLGEEAIQTTSKVKNLNKALTTGDTEKRIGFDFGDEGELSGLKGVFDDFSAQLGGDELALREHLSEQVSALREAMMTEEEMAVHRFEQRSALLREAFNSEVLSTEEHHALAQALEAQHMDELAEIRKKGMEKANEVTVDAMLGGISQLSRTMTSISSHYASEAQRLADEAEKKGDGMSGAAKRTAREMFDVHKAFAISDALISAAQGVAQTMGAYPMPYALALAVPHAAAAAAQVAMISSQQFGSGGTVRTPSAGGASSMPTGRTGGAVHGAGGDTAPRQNVIINLGGQQMFPRETILQLITGLNDAVADGARLVVQ